MPITLTLRRGLLILLAAGGMLFGAFQLGGNVTPDADNSRDVGSQSSRLANVYSVNVSSAFNSSTEMKVGNSGTILDGFFMTTTSIDPNALTAWSTTSAVISVSGMVAQDACLVANPYTASGTAVGVTGLAGSGTCTITFRSATSASFNAEPAVFTIFGASKRP